MADIEEVELPVAFDSEPSSAANPLAANTSPRESSPRAGTGLELIGQVSGGKDDSEAELLAGTSIGSGLLAAKTDLKVALAALRDGTGSEHAAADAVERLVLAAQQQPTPGLELTVRGIFGRLTEAPTNWHQAVVYALAAPQDEPLRQQARAITMWTVGSFRRRTFVYFIRVFSYKIYEAAKRRLNDSSAHRRLRHAGAAALWRRLVHRAGADRHGGGHAHGHRPARVWFIRPVR
jgi:hypothetical protein